MVSAEIFGLHPAMPEKKPQDSDSSRNTNQTSTLTHENLSFSHPFMSESSARVPVILYPLARRVGFSTLMLSALLYGITIIPALLAVSGYDPFGGSGLIPLALPVLIGAFAGRRRRRSFGVTIRDGNNLCSKFRLCRQIESLRQSLVKLLRVLFTSQSKHFPSIGSAHIQALPKLPNS